MAPLLLGAGNTPDAVAIKATGPTRQAHGPKRQSPRAVWPARQQCAQVGRLAGPLELCASTSSTVAAPEAGDLGSCGYGIEERFLEWRGHKIRYHCYGESGPAIVLIHGFGANCGHWRKNLPVLGKKCRVFALDLLGYGYSDKPNPRMDKQGSLYTYETWSSQVLDFMETVIGGPAFLVCNSIGGIVGLEAAVTSPSQVQGVQIHNISLRKLHVRNQAPIAKPLVKAFQDLLLDTQAGQWFFDQVARPETVKKILQKAYCDEEAVTDELVNIVLKPGLLPGASTVFLKFISYSTGPLPGDQLRDIKVPVSILWGAEDPWEKVEWGREFQEYPAVEEFVELPGVGHCPHDEAPHLVNPLVEKFVFRHATA
eukprot:evm.model.scf_343.5 EVM.evm.TU.scf_343.5   scf_343:31435-36314(-)